MTTTETALIIDCDSHVLEPPGLWDEYLDPEFRGRASVAGLSERRRRLVLGENAKALLRL